MITEFSFWMSCPFNLKVLLSWMFCCNCGYMDCVWPDRRTALPPPIHRTQTNDFSFLTPSQEDDKNTINQVHLRPVTVRESFNLSLSLFSHWRFSSSFCFSSHLIFLFCLQLMTLLHQTVLSLEDVAED